MGFKIQNSITYLLGISLEKPFPLGFGTLDQLPRVLLRLKASDGINQIEGVGEASIDFPFTNYDAWDIYNSLLQVDIKGKDVDDREEILNNEWLQENILLKFPSAFAALNMALDDLFGKANECSVQDIYGRHRVGGKAVASISFKENISDLIDEINLRVKSGFIPKVKAGNNIEKDVGVFTQIRDLLKINHIPTYVVDFNAQYSVDEFIILIDTLVYLGFHFEKALFLEQPISKQEGIAGLCQVKLLLESRGITSPVVADESFITMDNAINCAKDGILLNFKIQKIGGGYQACKIERGIYDIIGHASDYRATVGGTFPTAIGRVYDQHCASVLQLASLPGDAWEPSTDWFMGEKHLILEDFQYDDVNGIYIPFQGSGLGITVNWEKIKSFIVSDPKKEYTKIRQGFSGSKISINLRKEKGYQETYETLSAKPWDWNLR